MDEKKNQRSDYKDELDQFWDIDSLIPNRRLIPKSQRTDTVEISESAAHSRESASTARSIPIPPRHEGETVVHSVSHIAEDHAIHGYVGREDPLRNQPQPEYEYAPASALLHRVQVFRWKGSYQYYEEFLKTAEKLLDIKGIPCEYVKFFSYVPQYSQMTRSQLGWYLWFRECVKRGLAPNTDYSYILLLVYEIINLSDRIPPTEGQKLLFHLWKSYRATYPQLDNYLAEWICDYSLIHRLPPPAVEDRSQLASMMKHCTLKEFYVEGDSTEGYVQALLIFCANYDYRKSKFYTEETSALFESAMKTVMSAVVEGLSRDGKLFSATDMEDSLLTRDAYTGALCSYRRKRKLKISYCSFSRSHELRFLITDVLKYTENKLRAHLGIRSRLTVYALPDRVRALIEESMVGLLPRKAAVKQEKTEEIPSYEKLYDLPVQPLDPSRAAEIERLSWDTTKRLVEAFEEAPAAELPITEPMPTTPSPLASLQTDDGGLSEKLRPYAAFLRAVDQEDCAEQRRVASQMNKLPDAIADEINEIAAEELGDILLESDGGEYCLIEDYRDALEDLL